MGKLRCIRYEVVNDINPNLNCGLFVFPVYLLNTQILSQEEIDRFNQLQAELTEPELPGNQKYTFYFTEEGFTQYAHIVNVVKKALLPIFEIKESYLEIERDDNRIVYKDDMQIAIL